MHRKVRTTITQQIHRIRRRTVTSELWDDILAKKRHILSRGLNYEEMAACQNNEMRQYIESLEIIDPLQPPDSFFGSKTNATCLYYEAKEGKEIYCMEFTCLYPWIHIIYTSL